MVPSFDGGDDLGGILCPAEWPRVCVGLGEEPLDGGLEFHDGAEHAPLQSPHGKFGEIPFDGIQPRR
jgi:hypothetical protein